MKRHRKARSSTIQSGKVTEGRARKGLPLLIFEHSASVAIKEFAAKLPPTFTQHELAQIIDEYLDLSVKKIQLEGRFRQKVVAIDIEKVYDPKKYPDLLEQDDFRQRAEPLFVDDNFLMLNPLMQSIKDKAREIGIAWDIAAPIISRVADKMRPDQRPESVKRGELCERIIAEMKEIRAHHTEFRTFEELEHRFPDFLTSRMLKGGAFDSEDQDLLAHPNQWESPIVHVYGLLKKRFHVNSNETIKKYRKAYKVSLR